MENIAVPSSILRCMTSEALRVDLAKLWEELETAGEFQHQPAAPGAEAHSPKMLEYITLLTELNRRQLDAAA